MKRILITTLAALLVAGCANMPPEVESLLRQAYERAVEHARKRQASQAPATDPQQVERPAGQSADTAPASAEKLVFRFGGFRGASALEDPATQIGSVRMSRSGMSYKWTKGDLSNWGLAREKADALACAFYWSESEKAWIGGKFDWISTSRTTRDFKNIDEGYHGWDAKAFWEAPRRAFCIVSEDGRVRTNLEVAQ